MAERRSLNAAMTLTPDKLAFIKGPAGSNDKPASEPTAQTVETTAEPTRSADKEVEESPRPQRRRNRGRVASEPQPNEILDQILVPVTFRLQHRTAQALKRALLEQKLKHLKPDKLQEIGEEAVTEWLERIGYLDS